MKRKSTVRSCLLRDALGVVLCFSIATAAAAEDDWPRWGGPHGDFTVGDLGIATRWPETGPPLLWRRALGDHGHSAIVVEGDRLYTLFRRGERDVVIALDATNGQTLWEHAYEAPLPDGYVNQFGPGPHSSPLIAGDRLVTVGSLSQLKVLDKQTGEVLWGKDLLSELEAPLVARGYGASPVAWKDLVIVPVGGQGQGIVAFRQGDGEIIWRALDGRAGYSTPILVTIDGKEQLAVVMGPKRAGLDPTTGELLWQLEFPETAATVMSTQLQVGDNLIFGSSAYADGSRVFSVHLEGETWKAEERWYNRKMGIMHQTAVQFGNHVYGSSGDFGPTFLAAVDIETGELAFRARGFAKANLVRIGDKVLILDEDGQLALGSPSPDGIEILARADISDGVSWTAPTVVGTNLWVRNRTEIMAFDLGEAALEDLVTELEPESSGSDGDASAAGSRLARARGTTNAVPERSLSGQTLIVPTSELEQGLAYFVMPGDDAQLAVTSRTPLQKTVARHNQVVGYLIAPFDLEQLSAGAEPVLSAAFRVPAKTLTTGSASIDRILHGQLVKSSEHPEITFRLERIEDLEILDSPSRETGEPAETGAGSETFRFRFEAFGALTLGGQRVEIQAPVELTFRRSNNQTMGRYVGDLAFLESRFDLDLEQAGVQVPPPMAALLASAVEVDLYLAFSTVTPDKTLDPSMTQDSHQKETRFLTLLRDLDDPEAAYSLAREYVERRWDDAEALYRVATTIVAEPSIRHRDLLFAERVISRANDLRQGRHALTLNTLARVQSEMGDLESAVATQRQALEQLGEAASPMGARLRENLERLEKRLAATSP